MSKKTNESEVQNPPHIRKRFGEYLVEKGLITPEQLNDALAIQNSINYQLGILASMEDVISVSQIFNILNKQKDTGKPFGETAKLLNLIDDSQLEKLLKQQEEHRMKVGEILVGLLYLEKDELDRQLDAFIKEIQEMVDQK